MSILVDIYTLPNKTVFIWDTPSEAKSFADGKNIWGYLNIIWGNRSGVREDLPGYPIKVGDVKKLGIDFDFEKLYGTDDYKIALNNFFTKENTLQPLKTNTGDFFFVFDQIGNYIPKYSVTMPDITLGGNFFSVLYTKNQATGRDSRRLIIKDGRQWLKGTLDLLSVYKLFIDNGYIDTNQYIPNIQIGIEVTKGFAGVRVNKWSIQKE